MMSIVLPLISAKGFSGLWLLATLCAWVTGDVSSTTVRMVALRSVTYQLLASADYAHTLAFGPVPHDLARAWGHFSMSAEHPDQQRGPRHLAVADLVCCIWLLSGAVAHVDPPDFATT